MEPGDLRVNDRVAGVVILYQPPGSVLTNVQTYLKDVGVLFVWDNSPECCQSRVGTLRQFDRVVYFTEGRNVGIARALNVAAKRAMKEGFDFLLTMDQDSYASDGMIGTMLSLAANDTSIGLITPFHLDRNAPQLPPVEDVEPVVTAMTSGNLVRLSAHEKVGGFMEKLFIDYVDIEFCLRLQIKGFSVIRANRAILSHEEGHFTNRRFFGLTVHPTNHGPARYYYRTRNRIYLRRLYGHRFPLYFRHDRRVYWRSVLKMLMYETQRCHKLVMIVRGLSAWLRNDFESISIP